MYTTNIWGTALEDLVDDNPGEVTTMPEAENDMLVAAAEADDAVAALIECEIQSDNADVVVQTNLEVITDTQEVKASLEGLREVGMTKAMASAAIYNKINIATRNMYSVENKIGSLEDFGDNQPSSVLVGQGLEGLDDFLRKLKSRLTDNLKLKAVTFSQFMDSFTLTHKSVSERAKAVLALAKTLSKDPTTTSITLDFTQAAKMSLSGKITGTIPAEISKLTKLSKLVFQDHVKRVNSEVDGVAAFVTKFDGLDFEQAQKHFLGFTKLKPVEFVECKTKVPQRSGPTVQFSRSYELLGGKCFVSETYLPMNTGDECHDAFKYATVAIPSSRNSIQDLQPANTKMDLSINTLKPAEIIRIAEEVLTLMKELENNTISKTQFAELQDRLFKTSGDGTFGISRTVVKGEDGAEDIQTSDTDYAQLLSAIEDSTNGFLTMFDSALSALSKDFITYACSESNAALAVCERSLKCYPELVSSKIGTGSDE